MCSENISFVLLIEGKRKKRFFRSTTVDIPFTSGFIFDVLLVNVKSTRRKLVTEKPLVNRQMEHEYIFFLCLSCTRNSVDKHFHLNHNCDSVRVIQSKLK